MFFVIYPERNLANYDITAVTAQLGGNPWILRESLNYWKALLQISASNI